MHKEEYRKEEKQKGLTGGPNRKPLNRENYTDPCLTGGLNRKNGLFFVNNRSKVKCFRLMDRYYRSLNRKPLIYGAIEIGRKKILFYHTIDWFCEKNIYN